MMQIYILINIVNLSFSVVERLLMSEKLTHLKLNVYVKETFCFVFAS